MDFLFPESYTELLYFFSTELLYFFSIVQFLVLMRPEITEESHWFAENLQPHEAMLRAWLHSRFSNEHDIDDIVQEAYFKVLKARKTTKITSPKAFLFATARNLALEGIRKKSVRSELSLVDLNEFDLLNDEEDVNDAVARSEELEILTRAIQSLPTRCRQIITLRKIYGMSQKDIAKELGISVHTVETQGTIGIRHSQAHRVFRALGTSSILARIFHEG